MNKTTVKRINREIADLQKEDLAGIVLEPDEKNIHHWKGYLPGPQGTPYQGGMFEVDIELPNEYPFAPPRMRFITRIYHCNINVSGMICLDTLKTNWSPALSVHKVMLTLQGLLQDPNPADPLDRSVADMYMKNRAQHDEIAKEFTRKHAVPKQIKAKRKQGEETTTSPSGVPTTTPLQRTTKINTINLGAGTRGGAPIEVEDEESSSLSVEGDRAKKRTKPNNSAPAGGRSGLGNSGEEPIVID